VTLPKLPKGFWARHRQQLIDTHCHLGDGYDPQVYQNILNSGMVIHNMSTTPEQYLQNRLHIQHQNVRHALGLFPLELQENRLQQALDLAPEADHLGEWGLDFSDGAPDRNLQYSALNRLFESIQHCSPKIISLHSRKAGEELMDLCRAWTQKGKCQHILIFHWYSGPLPNFNTLNHNIYFSVNTAMLRSRNGKALLQACPPSRILLESDGPYIKVGEHPASPLHLCGIVEALSQRWKMSMEQTLSQLIQNQNHISLP
jgi:TatD DNase family protein